MRIVAGELLIILRPGTCTLWRYLQGRCVSLPWIATRHADKEVLIQPAGTAVTVPAAATILAMF